MKTQYHFPQELETYINGAIFSLYDLYISLFSKSLPFRRYAIRICGKYSKIQDNTTRIYCSNIKFSLQPYERNNRHVILMRVFLEQHLKENLFGAYVLGSLGTYEENSYSDFDALVIIKDEVFKSPSRLARAAQKLNSARSIMYDFDPLQHHGWFVLAEAQLAAYPQWYFPIVLFEHAKSLFKNKGLELTIRCAFEEPTAREIFFSFCENLLNKLQNHNNPKNLYELKVLLSSFMLLPALFIQARDGHGIFKKFSFEAAKSDFSKNEWSIMDEVSNIRANWFYQFSPFKRWLFSNPHPLCRYLAKKFGPPISPELERLLSKQFYERMVHFIQAMKREISLKVA